MQRLLVVLITRSSIFFHGSVNHLYRNEQVFEILFLTLTYPQSLFFLFSSVIIYKSIKDLKMEQHVISIMAEMKLRRRAKYERLDEQLQQLVSSFDLISRDM